MKCHAVRLFVVPWVFTSATVKYFMAEITKAHQIAFLVCTAVRYRLLVVNQRGGSAFALAQTFFAQRMRRDVSVSYLFPRSPVALATVVTTGEVVIVAVHQLCVRLTIHAVRQPGTAGIAAGSFRFSWHYSSPLGIRKATHRIAPMNGLLYSFGDYIISCVNPVTQ